MTEEEKNKNTGGEEETWTKERQKSLLERLEKFLEEQTANKEGSETEVPVPPAPPKQEKEEQKQSRGFLDWLW